MWSVSVNAAADPFLAVLSDSERAEMERFVFVDDRRRYAHAHGAMRQLVGDYLGLAPSSVELTHDELGKPRVVGTKLQLSLAHADELALVAIGWDGAIGVDVERIRHLPDVEALKQTCFTERERIRLERCNGDTELIQLWTRKEALLKATGEGLRRHPGTVDVLDSEPLPGWRLFDVPPARGYAGAVAVRGQVKSILTGSFVRAE